MGQKKRLWIAAGAAAAALILAALLWPDGAPAQTPPGPAQTVPTEHIPAETAPSVSAETTVPEPSVPADTTGTGMTRPTEPMETTTPPDTEPAETEPPVYATVQFPVALEDGRLTVQSILQFSGMNPDVGGMVGEEIAGIHMTNTSEQYLHHAEITAVLADGTTLTFRVDDVPPGRSAMAFSLEHEPLEEPKSCEEIFGYAEFSDGDQLAGELVSVSVSGAEITLTNVSGRTLTDLDVICHELLSDSYFGGISYSYSVASLPSGGSAVVYAGDCTLGMAEVVRVEIGGGQEP